MSKFERMCYLIVQREKANKKRRHLLYLFRKAHPAVAYATPINLLKISGEELKSYRNHAEAMKKIAKEVYSPLKRELKASIKYTGSNFCIGMTYDKEYFSYSRIEEIANAYIFDEIVLRNSEISNPYKELI